MIIRFTSSWWYFYTIDANEWYFFRLRIRWFDFYCITIPDLQQKQIEDETTITLYTTRTIWLFGLGFSWHGMCIKLFSIPPFKYCYISLALFWYTIMHIIVDSFICVFFIDDNICRLADVNLLLLFLLMMMVLFSFWCFSDGFLKKPKEKATWKKKKLVCERDCSFLSIFFINRYLRFINKYIGENDLIICSFS